MGTHMSFGAQKSAHANLGSHTIAHTSFGAHTSWGAHTIACMRVYFAPGAYLVLTVQCLVLVKAVIGAQKSCQLAWTHHDDPGDSPVPMTCFTATAVHCGTASSLSLLSQESGVEVRPRFGKG